MAKHSPFLLLKLLKNLIFCAKKKVKNQTLSNLERLEAQKALEYKKAFRLQVRMRRRCGVTGDPRGFNGRYGLSRNELRKLISYNLIPGVKKASW